MSNSLAIQDWKLLPNLALQAENNEITENGKREYNEDVDGNAASVLWEDVVEPEYLHAIFPSYGS